MLIVNNYPALDVGLPTVRACYHLFLTNDFMTHRDMFRTIDVGSHHHSCPNHCYNFWGFMPYITVYLNCKFRSRLKVGLNIRRNDLLYNDPLSLL